MWDINKAQKDCVFWRQKGICLCNERSKRCFSVYKDMDSTDEPCLKQDLFVKLHLNPKSSCPT